MRAYIQIWLFCFALCGALPAVAEINNYGGGGGGTTITDSASLRNAISDETGTGLAFFQNGNIGDASATSLTFTDARLSNDGTNILAQMNGANAQTFRVYNSDVGGNDEFLNLGWDTVNNLATIGAGKNGGGSFRALRLIMGGSSSTPAIEIPSSVAGQMEFFRNNLTAAINGSVTVRRSGGQTATSGQHADFLVGGNATPTATSTLNFRSLSVTPTINYSNATPGAGSYTGLYIGITETALPTGTNYLIRALAGATASTEKFAVLNTGAIVSNGATGVSVTCTVLPTNMTITNGLITSVTGGTCS